MRYLSHVVVAAIGILAAACQYPATRVLPSPVQMENTGPYNSKLLAEKWRLNKGNQPQPVPPHANTSGTRPPSVYFVPTTPNANTPYPMDNDTEWGGYPKYEPEADNPAGYYLPHHSSDTDSDYYYPLYLDD